MRTFLALSLSLFEREVGRGIGVLQNKILDVIWLDPTQVHLTLHFFGEISEAQISQICPLIEAASKVCSPFELYLSEYGCFPDPQRAKVIWIGLGGEIDKLKQFQSRIVSSFRQAGFPVEDRLFKPHATVGRIKKHAAPLKIDFLALKFDRTPTLALNELTLYKSTLGQSEPRYEVLKTFLLTP